MSATLAASSDDKINASYGADVVYDVAQLNPTSFENIRLLRIAAGLLVFYYYSKCGGTRNDSEEWWNRCRKRCFELLEE